MLNRKTPTFIKGLTKKIVGTGSFVNLKKRHKSARKKWAIALLVVAFLIVLSFSLAFYKGPEKPPKKTPDEYFEFSNMWGIAKSVANSTVRFTNLYFDITATGGDAHHIAVITTGMTDPSDYYLLELKNGTIKPIEIAFPYEVQSTRREDVFPIVFPIDLRIFCDEAEGDITLYIPESDLIIV